MRCPSCLGTGYPLVVEVTAPRTVRFAVDEAAPITASGESAVRLFDSRSGEHWEARMEVREQRAQARRQFVECPHCGPVECEVILPEDLFAKRRVFIVNPEAAH